MQTADTRSQRSRAAAETAALLELLGSYENYGQVRGQVRGQIRGRIGKRPVEENPEGACA